MHKKSGITLFNTSQTCILKFNNHLWDQEKMII